MKKKLLVISFRIIAVIIALILFYLIGTGFMKSVDEIVINYSVSEDGSKINFKTGSWQAIGYTRGFKDKEKDHAHYLTFYSTFGGINSRFGAKNEFELELDEDDTEIYFNTVVGEKTGFELVLQKNQETGEW